MEQKHTYCINDDKMVRKEDCKGIIKLEIIKCQYNSGNVVMEDGPENFGGCK